MSLEIKQLPKSEIEITGEMPAEEFSIFWQKAVKELSKNISLSGFRPGKVPEKIFLEKVAEGAILDKAAELALQDAYLKIIKEKKIEAIGYPQATVTKITKGGPLGFKFQTAVLPEIKLPENYKKIAAKVAQKKEKIVVEEKEQLEIMDTILKNSQFEIPQVLIESEKVKMLSGFKTNILNMGLKWEDYLLHVKKSEKEILDGWNEDALKRVKYGLLLDQLGRVMEIKVSEEEMENKSKEFGIVDQKVDKSQIMDYAYSIIRNEKIFSALGG
ncbi:hypothetical protein KKB69_00695 [Patescibacteria group bacterium]|nr:hypothetical protein [Patescibacteria group bacterium]